MRKTLLKNIGVIAIAITPLLSCQTEIDDIESVNEIANSQKIERTYASLLYSKKTEGSVLIQSNANLLNQSNNKNIGVSQVLNKNKGSKSKTNIEFTDFDFDNEKRTSLDQSLSSAFGKTIEYTITSTSDNSKSSTETSNVYIPELLNVTYSTKTIQEGTIISWNTDLKNENGLVIYANYNPAAQPDVRIAFENPQRVKETVFLTEQAGKYIVQASDLERFPKNAIISIDVIRAGFSVEQDKPVIAGLTKVNSDTKVIR